MSNFDEERRKEYEAWYDKTSFHPLTDWDKIMEDPQVLLPTDGRFHMIANNLGEIKEFFWKLETLDRWVTMRILKDPFRDLQLGIDEDEDNLEVKVVKEIRNIKTLNYNQYFEQDKRLQVYQTEETQTLYDLEFYEDFLEELTYPCLVQYSGEGGFDRGGDYEMNHCQILNLTGCPLREGPVKIHLYCI